MELQANRTQAKAIGLVGEIRPTNSEEFGTLRQIEAVRMPVINRGGKGGAKVFSSGSGVSSHLITRRTQSSVSLAPIGPPNTTTPSWSARVFGNGSPQLGRRTSSLTSMALRATPTRPGVECSWCSTIKTVGCRARLPRVMGSNSIAACVRRQFESPLYVGNFRATSLIRRDASRRCLELVRDVALLPDLPPAIYGALRVLRPPSLSSSSGLGRRPLTAKTGVRVPLGAPIRSIA